MIEPIIFTANETVVISADGKTLACPCSGKDAAGNQVRGMAVFESQ